MTVPVAVVVCTHDVIRLAMLKACVEACMVQLRPRDELVVVCDGPPRFLEQVQGAVGSSVRVVRSMGSGLSAARNHGVSLTAAPVVVFIDDDASPRAGWLRSLSSWFDEDPDRIVSGSVVPRWIGRSHPPIWFPDEFGWVVGCDYTGLPAHGGEVRNPIGANMAIGRHVLEQVGGFDERLGRHHHGLAGCEETALAIQAVRSGAASGVVHDGHAIVDHAVGADRQRVGYLVRRCIAEGRSTAHLSALVGRGPAMSSERRHATLVLPRCWMTSLAQMPRRPFAAVSRTVVSMIGLVSAAIGYAYGLSERVHR